MNNSVALPNWSIDAFGCLSSKLLKSMSDETISRVDSFVTSVILFEQVVLSENYRNDSIVTELNKQCPNSIKIVSGNDLFHSTNMTNHISIDVDLFALAFDELGLEDQVWQRQHDPKMMDVIVESLASNSDSSHHFRRMLDQKFMTQLRLWHWCYTNEMAELTDSVTLLPLSLNTVGEFALQKKEKTDVVLKKYYEYATHHDKKVLRMSEPTITPFVSELRSIPPFLTLLLSRCKDSEDMLSVLIDMRKEFSEFRKLRHQFTQKVKESSTIGEQSDLVSDWNRSWEVLVKGEFKKPSLLSRKVSSSDVASSIVSVETGGLKTFISHFLDHLQGRKSFKQFQVFSNLEEQINNVSNEELLIGPKFGVNDIVSLN